MDERKDIAWVMVNHLAEIVSGRCSITLADVQAHSDQPELAEVMAGLMYLHEELHARERERDKAMDELRQAMQRMRQQHEELLLSRALNDELSTPVMKVGGDIILVPLIGGLDDNRASVIMERLLDAVKRERARHVILDITGLSRLNSSPARYFVRFATALRFLGARLVFAGVGPEIAKELATAAADDVDLSLLSHSFREVQDAWSFCADRRGRRTP